MGMLNCFYSLLYANRGDLFEELNIWKYEKYQKIQGTWPVIFLSFADVKQANAGDAIQKIIATVCHQFENVLKGIGEIYYTYNIKALPKELLK